VRGKRQRVLFLCTGNSARSQLAEALLRHHADDMFEAHSAGLEPVGVRPETLAVLEEKGVETAGLRSKSVEEFLGSVHFHYLITVCALAEENCPSIWPGVSHKLSWPIDDPAVVEGEDRLEAFRAARDAIDARVREWLDEQEAQPDIDD